MENVVGGAALKQKEVRKESIFTLGSPERETKSKKDQGFGVFLSACSLCKKKLKPVDDINMYGYVLHRFPRPLAFSLLIVVLISLSSSWVLFCVRVEF
ncbi:hypothetical protein PTKIN_Ptkin10aG0053700 [Pterospermum kingtungense]